MLLDGEVARAAAPPEAPALRVLAAPGLRGRFDQRVRGASEADGKVSSSVGCLLSASRPGRWLDPSGPGVNALAVGILVFVSASPGYVADDRLPVAEAAVAARASSEVAKGYDATIGQAFGTEHSATIGRCARESTRPDLSNFSLYLRLGAAGSVEEALVRPETNVSVCVRTRLAGWKAPRPPSGGFWVKIGVSLKPQRR